MSAVEMEIKNVAVRISNEWEYADRTRKRRETHGGQKKEDKKGRRRRKDRNGRRE